MGENFNFLVYLIEDDKVFEYMVGYMVGSEGNKHVKTFNNVEDCLNENNETPKCIILDHHLESNITGLDSLPKLQKRFLGVPIFVLSSQDDASVAIEYINKGVSDYIVKNYDGLIKLTQSINDLKDGKIKSNKNYFLDLFRKFFN